MKLKQVITIADVLRPNAISDEIKAEWIYNLEGEVADFMKVTAPTNAWPNDAELLMPYPHDDFYQYYLMAMIDYANREMNDYQIDYLMANTKLEEAKKFYVKGKYSPTGQIKLKQVIAMVDEIRPNTISDSIKAEWLFALEGQVADVMKVNAPTNTWPNDTNMLMPYPYDDIYQYYLMYMVDVANGDGDKKTLDYSLFTENFDEAKKHYVKGKYTPTGQIKLKQVIAIVDELRPNSISDAIKSEWLFAFEGDVAEFLGVAAPANPWPNDKEMLMPYPHDDIYQYYLMYMIDIANGDAEKKNLDYLMFNERYDESKKSYKKNHYVPSTKNWKVM